jgi:crotonobetainyl-CoA:carnitine CoA-transferase CaiB-like acyl-CoA transferase
VTDSEESTQGPLEGVRMIEFGQLLAGPYCASLMADFGAEVIKVEAPPAGDPMRVWGREKVNDHTLWWPTLARSKKVVTLNLREPRGQELALELMAKADVALENFSPGTMEKWNIGPDEAMARNPRLIYARVSGYGQTGRYKDRVGFAAAGEAMGGLRYFNGYPGQAPPRAGISLGDTLAAKQAFEGILMALYWRDARGSGTGQVIDAAIVDACFAMTESTITEYGLTGVIREPSGSYLSKIAPSNVHQSKDGKWVVIAANHDSLWKRLSALMGRPELAEDERYATHRARGEHEHELYAMIDEWAAQYTAAELDAMLAEANVVSAGVYSAADMYDDPHFRERGLIVDIEDPEIGTMPVPGITPKLSQTPGSIRWGGKWEIGADNEEIWCGLVGLSQSELGDLQQAGIV